MKIIINNILIVTLIVLASCNRVERRVAHNDFTDWNGRVVDKNNPDFFYHKNRLNGCASRAQKKVFPKYFGGLTDKKYYNVEYNQIVEECAKPHFKLINKKLID
tara:strand:+ start:934 stop:1245 length:312 start_codon:yes stop_codon:yes gene_type:complete